MDSTAVLTLHSMAKENVKNRFEKMKKSKAS